MRGKPPVPEPRSTCPNCGRYFEGERCPNCQYKRGDWDKRSSKKPLSVLERALLALDEWQKRNEAP